MFVLTWFGSAVTTVALPMIIFMGARLANDADGNQEGQQQNNYNYKNYGCKWYQLQCRRTRYNYYNGNNANEQQGEERDDGLPWWWLWAHDDARREEETNPTMVFTYVWSIILFSGLIFYGYRAYSRGSDLSGVVASLVVFANFSFLSMMFLGGLEGGVQADGPEIEEDGFYGQLGVLMYMTSFLWTIFAVVFAIVLYRKNSQRGITQLEYGESDYQSYDAPKVQDAV